MEHARHVLRVLLVLVVALGGFVIARAFAVPETYGVRGPYRYSNIAEQVAKLPRHGGNASCQGCHEEQFNKQAEGGHKTMKCEICHGPVARHAEGDKKIADAPVIKSWQACTRCHAQSVGRPAEFSQIDAKSHVEDVDEKLEGSVCLNCHDAHGITP